MNYEYLKTRIDTNHKTLVKRLNKWVEKGQATKKVLNLTKEGFTIQYNFDTLDKLGNKKPSTLLVQQKGNTINGVSLYV